MNMRIICFAVILSIAVCSASSANTTTDASDPVTYFIFKKSCLDTFLQTHSVTGDCFKFTLSRGLSLGIVVFSTVVKLPQIIKILNKKSVVGLSLTAFFSELIGLTLVVGYNVYEKNPFSTYGENVFVLLQALIIFMMFPQYAQNLKQARFFGYLAFWASLVAFFALNLVPDYVYQIITLLSLFITISARLPQVYENYKNKSTGQLSFITATLNFMGTAARIFTTIQELTDPIYLALTINATVWNGLLFLQCLIYWKNHLPLHKEHVEVKKVEVKNADAKKTETKKIKPN